MAKPSLVDAKKSRDILQLETYVVGVAMFWGETVEDILDQLSKSTPISNFDDTSDGFK